MRHNLRLYRRVLGITAKFLCLAVLTTQQRLESCFHELQQHDPFHKHRVLIRHCSREAAVLSGMIDSEFDVLRDGTQQSQQSQQPVHDPNEDNGEINGGDTSASGTSMVGPDWQPEGEAPAWLCAVWAANAQ